MRSICKKGSVTLVAVLALCALTAGSASAAQWYVGGKALTGTEKLAETIKVEQNIVLTFELGDGPKGEDNPTLTCTGMTAPKSELGASGTIKLGTPLLTGCKLVEPYFPACKLGSGPEIGLQTLEAKMTAGNHPKTPRNSQAPSAQGNSGPNSGAERAAKPFTAQTRSRAR